jgi:hypothetical protein
MLKGRSVVAVDASGMGVPGERDGELMVKNERSSILILLSPFYVQKNTAFWWCVGHVDIDIYGLHKVEAANRLAVGWLGL